MTDTVAIFGGARRHGNTGSLLDYIAQSRPIDIVDVADLNLYPYDYHHTNKRDDFASVMAQIVKHKNIILASPIYWYAPSAQLKVFMDRLTDLLELDELKRIGRELRGKTGYMVCTSNSAEVDRSFIDSFIKTFEYLGMKYGGYLHANCKDGCTPALWAKAVDRFVTLLSSQE